MYPKNIPVISHKRHHGIAYFRVNCHLDGKLYDARVEQEPLDTQFFFEVITVSILQGKGYMCSLIGANLQAKTPIPAQQR